MSDDLIKRSDAIGACAYGTIECYEARKAIRALPSADRPQEWIPCSERFPEEEGIYLVTATGYILDTTAIVVGTCYFNPDYKFISIKEILAWMPLPKPWKGANNDDKRGNTD